MWAGNSQLVTVVTANGITTLTYRHTDPTTGRTHTEQVTTRVAQTPAWIQNWGASRALELDALDAFTVLAESKKGLTVVTSNDPPPPTAAELAAMAWVAKVNEAQQIRAAKALGVATAEDDARLLVLVADIKSTYLPGYKAYLR